MKRFWWYGIIFLLSTPLWANAKEVDAKTQALAEKNLFTQPKVGVILVDTDTLRNRRVIPMFPTYLEKTGELYFANSDDGKGGDCPANHLYKLPLKGEGKKSIQKLSLQLWETENEQWETTPQLCLQAMHTDGKTVYVQYWEKLDQDRWLRLARLNEVDGKTRVIPPEIDKTNSWLDHALWGFQLDLFAGSEPENDLKPLNYFGFQIQNGDIYTVVDSSAQKLPLFLQGTTKPSGNMSPLSVWPLPLESDKAFEEKKMSFAKFQGHHLYLAFDSLKERGGFSGFYVFEIDTKNAKLKKVGRYGANRPYRKSTPWTSLGSRWAARSLHGTLTRYGMLFGAENYSNELANISYFSPALAGMEKPFFRVKGIKKEYLEMIQGLHTAENGFIVAFEDPRWIVWFGKKNPFGEKNFKSRRPDLNELDGDEYRELIEEVEEGKK